MILTVDIGNSNVVIGGVEENEIVFEARLRTESTKTSDQYCVDLKILLDVYGVDRSNIDEFLAFDKIAAIGGSFFVKEALDKMEGK